MKPASRAGVLPLLLLLLAGCSTRFGGFAFQTMDGRRIDIWQPAGGFSAEEARFRLPSARTSPLYHLATPVVTADAGQAFALTYTSDLAGCTLTLYADRKTVFRSVPLSAARGNSVRYLVPLEKGQRVWGFEVSLPEEGEGGITLEGAGTTRFVHGFSIAGGTLSVDGSVEVLSASASRVLARLPAATRDQMRQGTWIISVAFGEGSAGGRVAFDGVDGAHRAFVVDQQAAPRTIAFGEASIGWLPRDIRITGPMESLEISQIPRGAPIPSDPGLILASSKDQWRRPDFELYSWTLFPRVLIFDTASYDVQDDLFNRLAFFVEKAGHAGTIDDPAALAGIHGYNAHDYKADDLARFFTTARENNVALTPLETELSQMLVDNGVMVPDKEGFAPGDGCIISISQSSSTLLRELLLTHESFHGVYFSLPGFRQAVEKVWNGLSPVEQEVWKAFLASRDYDAADNYLVVNEFQAYVLQQIRSGVPGFQALTLSRLRSGSASDARLVASVLAEEPSSFLRAFDELDEALRAVGETPGGTCDLSETGGSARCFR